MSFPAHMVANATLIENTLILPTFSLEKSKNTTVSSINNKCLPQAKILIML